MAFLGEVASSILLFCLVFGMSATVEMKALKKQVQNRLALSIGVLMQFFILPFVGFCVVKIMHFPSTYGIMLMVITSSPGGSYSNWWCSLFNAELALSVTMTTVSTLLSVVMLPMNLILYTRWTYSEDVVDSLDWFGLIVSLVVVISGIGGGLYSSYRAEQRGDKASFRKTANRMGNVAGVLLVTLSIVVSSTGHTDSNQTSLLDKDAKFYIGVALPAILGLLVAVKLASYFELEKPERVAVAIESCYQNTGIATSVALALYDGDDLPKAIGVPLYYGIVEAVLLAVFCLVCWKRGWTKAPPEENCCKVIYNSYEVSDEDDEPIEGQNIEGNEPQQQSKRSVPFGSPSGGDATVYGKSGISGDTSMTSTDDDEESIVNETELTPSPSRVAVRSFADGAVSVVVEDDSLGNIAEAPQVVSAFDRVMATIRARVAGYGQGQQDEERGLRTKRGPVTLGLSQVPTPKTSRKQSTKKLPEQPKGTKPPEIDKDGSSAVVLSQDKTID